MGTPADGAWRPCPEGELNRLATRLTLLRRRRFALGLAVSGMVAAAVVVSGSAVASSMGWIGFGSGRHGCCRGCGHTIAVPGCCAEPEPAAPPPPAGTRP